MNKETSNKYFQRFFWAVFIFYLLILIKIVLLKDTDLSSLPMFLTGQKKGFRSLNLIPFQTFVSFFRIAGRGNFLWSFSNLLGNSLVFLPFGYLLCLLKGPKGSKLKIILSSALLSLFFETSQYVFYLGSADIDDLLLNVLGAGTGILCFQFLTVLCRKNQHRIYIISLILGCISFAAAGSIAYLEFGNRLGLVRYKTETIGGEDIPKRKPDYNGFVTSGNPKTIRCTSDIDEAFGEPSVITAGPDTKVFYLSYENDKTSLYQINTIYKRCSLSQLKSVKKYTKVSAWFSKKDKTAEIIVLSDPPGNSKNIKTNESSSQKKKLEGSITDIGSGSFSISKINSYKDKKSGGDISESTDIQIKVKYKTNTKVTVCDAYDQGTRTKNRKGSIRDIKKGRTVHLQGTVKNKVFYAETITVYIFHK
ncbi:VanZ family protein [Anaerostipes sp.]|uniref:VanZ family protein n=1 Tax=Anaerostipes sp. TaxID=1872530 RepID=UPI0025C1F5C3|nr:VanZ family protein [Anaerostipes sp.]MBS7007217.1 VanZ family protein [Anaerostipes sp.]